MTAVQTWSVFCTGTDPFGGQDIRCKAWAGQEATPDAAMAVARAHGWVTNGRDDLCPRHARQAARPAARRSTESGARPRSR